MDSKNGEPNHSAAETRFKFSIDSCNHLISTSLRDLSKQYQELSRAAANSEDLNKKGIAQSVPKAVGSDKK